MVKLIYRFHRQKSNTQNLCWKFAHPYESCTSSLVICPWYFLSQSFATLVNIDTSKSLLLYRHGTFSAVMIIDQSVILGVRAFQQKICLVGIGTT